MDLQDAYMFVVALVMGTNYRSADAAVIQAAVDMGDNSELLGLIFKQLEVLGGRRDDTSLSQTHLELVSALFRVAPVITIKGNITDPARRVTLTFTVSAEHHGDPSPDLDAEDDDDMDDWEGRSWRGSGGVFHPIVSVVEPYVLGFAEIVFNGILSTVISNLLETAHDLRLT